MKYLLIALLALQLLPAFAEETDPKVIVESIFHKAGQTEISQSQALQDEVVRVVDFDAMAKSSLGKRSLGKTDFAWFSKTLQEIITRTVFPEAPNFLKDVTITYKAVQITGNKAIVHSVVKHKADLTDVSYNLNKASGAWRVTDISLDGESWTSTIRDQVDSAWKKKQWKGVKDALAKKVDKLRLSK